MKTFCSATRIAFACGLVLLGFSLAAPSAHAGLFHRRTVVVETPTVYLAPVQTVYTVPVSTFVTTPAPTVVTSPVVDSAVTPTTYVPDCLHECRRAPVMTTYVPTVTTVPMAVVPARRVRVVYPRARDLLRVLKPIVKRCQRVAIARHPARDGGLFGPAR